MKKRLLVLYIIFLAGIQLSAQNEWPNYPYYHAEMETPSQEPFSVSTDKLDIDLIGVTKAPFVMMGAWVDQTTLGDTASYALDEGHTFITGQTTTFTPSLNDPRIVKEASSGVEITNGMGWDGVGTYESFAVMQQTLYYTIRFAKKGNYKLYLRNRGNNNVKYFGVDVFAKSDTSVALKTFKPLAAGINSESAVGDSSTDKSVEFVALGYDDASKNNDSYWFKTTDSISITTAGDYVIRIAHQASYRTNFGGFTFLKIPSKTLPEVSITSPEDGWNQKQGVPLSLSAVAEGKGGKTIAGVEFFEGENSIGTATLSGSTWVLENWLPAVGVYTVRAITTDSEDESTKSLPITINIEEIPDDVWADTIPNDSLIISEVMMGHHDRLGKAYIEFTNTSSKAIDLSKYYIHNTNSNGEWTANQGGFEGRLKKRLEGILLPGESWVITKREWNPALDGYGNRIWPIGTNNKEVEQKADMVINDYYTGEPGCFTIAYNVALTYVQLNGDSTRVDVFGPAKFDPETTNNQPHTGNTSEVTVAGKSGNNPIREYVFVRKYEVKKGNPLFDPQRGTDVIDSEWIPLPKSMYNDYEKAFTTVGSHGGSTELVLSSEIASIDKDAKTITLPYGISRDSVFRAFEIGANTGWDFVTGPDTSQFFVQTADTMRFYVAGSGPAAEYVFHVNVLPQTEAFAKVRPLIYKNDASNWVKKYSISDGLATDTIGNIPFHESIDTFVKYMAMEAGATAEGLAWKIIPASGIGSPEIEYGDILEVIASNGSKKEYLLATNEYFPSHNADLSLVIFPGLDLFYNTETFLPTDTMKTFATNNLQYVVDLPAGSKSSPAIIAKAVHNRAVVTVSRAKNLSGSAEDQTATIKVTAEDDTTIKEYKILFKVQRDVPSVKGSLFISDMARGWGRYYKDNYQLYNPTDEFIDLSEYVLIVLSGNDQYQSLLDNCATDQTWENQNANILRPGYKVIQQPDGSVVFQTDLVQDVVLLDPKGVYALANFQAFPMQNKWLGAFPAEWNSIGYKLSMWVQGDSGLGSAMNWWSKYVELSGAPADPYENGSLLGKGFKFDPRDGNSLILAKIVNDSIKNGLKGVALSYDQVKTDYEIIDVFNGETGDNDWTQFDNDTVNSWLPAIAGIASYSFTRKPEIYQGNPIDKLSFGLGDSTHTVVPSEWNVINDPSTRQLVRDDAYVKFGDHLFLSNAHISYLTSSSYLLGEGIDGPQDVFGVEANTSGNAFIGTMIKADPGMTIKLFNADNTPKDLDADVAEGDKMWSISANGSDSVLYVVKSIGALSGDCSLTSSAYTVTKDGKTGKIAGVDLGTSIRELLATLTPAAGASMIQTNGGEVVIPLMQFDNDTVKIKDGVMIETKASEMVYIEVVAQNKVDTCIYALAFNEVSVPYLLSDVYVVDEATKLINFVSPVTPEKFMSKLIVSPGATAEVVNKANQQRTTGIMKYDDRVNVMKDNVLVTYYIKFTAEEGSGSEVVLDKTAREAFGAYPNPTSDFVTLSGFNSISKIVIRDLTGKTIKIKTSVLDNQTIDFRSYPTGMYIVTVESNGVESSIKVMKE